MHDEVRNARQFFVSENPHRKTPLEIFLKGALLLKMDPG
jgi:hypothetical protein